MTPAADLWNVEDPTACPICGTDRCEDHLPALTTVDTDAPVGLRAFTLDELRVHRFPPRRALLTRDGTPILRAGQLAEVFAERGIGKTWFLESLGLSVAAGSSVLGIASPEPCRVLYLDGEMAREDIKARFDLLEARLDIPRGTPFTVLAADWQENYLPRLDTVAGQEAVEPFVEAADLVILDNRGCLFDPEGEKDATAWQPAQDWLLSLRRRGKAVIMAHHSNRQGGARGHSKAEDPLDLVIKLARPDDYSADHGARFVATFEKTRGFHGAAAAPFAARLTPEGWQLETSSGHGAVADKLLNHVRLQARAGERVKTASAAIRGAGVQKQAGLKAWADLLDQKAVHPHPDGGFDVR